MFASRTQVQWLEIHRRERDVEGELIVYLSEDLFEFVVVLHSLLNSLSNDRVENRSAENEILHFKHRLRHQPGQKGDFHF